MRAALASDGFALIRGVLNADEVATARSRNDGLAPIGWDLTGSTDRDKNVFNRDPYWLSFRDRDGVIDLAEHRLGAERR